jgi:hypothetical protein
MSAPETSQPVPQFEVPSGLPEGPWDLFEDDDGFWSIAAAGLLLVDTITDEQIARAIAAIPEMVEEIGRLQTAWHDAECERDRLRALSAEMREPIKEYIRDFLTCACDPSACRTARRRIELQSLLAKSESASPESQSATTHRGPGLPAQAPAATSTQPAPGGTIETETEQ